MRVTVKRPSGASGYGDYELRLELGAEGDRLEAKVPEFLFELESEGELIAQELRGPSRQWVDRALFAPDTRTVYVEAYVAAPTEAELEEARQYVETAARKWLADMEAEYAPTMTPNTMRYERGKRIGDRGVVYEFNIKLGTKTIGVNVTDHELEDDARMAIEALEDDLRASYPWIGRVYREGRSGGWLALEDKTGGATEDDLKAINDQVDRAVEAFEDDVVERYGYESRRRLRRNASIDPKLRKAYDFFKEHAGYVVGQRGLGALELARAERYADEQGWEAIWEEDPEPYDTDDEDDRPLEVLTCLLRDENGVVIGSLGGIGMSGNARQDKDYGRVVEAELALEAMHEKGLKPNARRPSSRYVDELSEKSLPRLRSMQSVVHQQIARAAEHRNTRAVEELQTREREIEAAIMRREFGHEPNGAPPREARKFVTGSGPWWTFYKKGTIRGGDLEIHIHRVQTEQSARIDAQRVQREVGGFVGIFHNGIEVDSVGPERASWNARPGVQTPNARRSGTRRYRMGPHGEEPVWASKRKLEEMGRDEGREAAREGRQPIRMGNLTFDKAALDEYNERKSRR